MTTIAMNTLSARARTAPRARNSSFIELRAALPDMPASDSTTAIALGVAGRLALAAVPFAALSWLFVTV